MEALADWTALEIAALVASLLAAGLAAGFIGGLLGVGGGIVMTPATYQILAIFDVDEGVRMHVAVATSLATIVAVSARSTAAHARRGAVDRELLRRYGPAVAAGSIAGGLVASAVSTEALKLVFGIVCVVMAAFMAATGDARKLADGVPKHPATHAGAFGVGGLSSVMGIGGGMFGVTAMSMSGVPIHRAVGTGAGLGLLIGLPAALLMVATGWGEEGLPFASLGYVNLAAFAIYAPMTFLSTPWGARTAHALPRRALRMAFAGFLAVAGARMLWPG